MIKHASLNRLTVAVTLAFVIVYMDMAILAVVLTAIQKTFNTNHGHVL